MIEDSFGSSVKMGGRASVERVERYREEHPEIILASYESSIKEDLGVFPGRKVELDKARPRRGHWALRPLQKSTKVHLDCRRRTRRATRRKQASRGSRHFCARSTRLPAGSAAVITFHRENAALESGEKLLAPPKREDDDGAAQILATPKAAWGTGKGKTKRKTETARVTRLDPTKKPCATALLFPSERMEPWFVVEVASLHFWPPRLSLRFPNNNLVDVGSRQLMAGLRLGVAVHSSETIYGPPLGALFNGSVQVVCAVRTAREECVTAGVGSSKRRVLQFAFGFCWRQARPQARDLRGHRESHPLTS